MYKFKNKVKLIIEEHLKIKIVDIKIPPQGMDSQVFFVIDGEDVEYVVKSYRGSTGGDVVALNLIKENNIDIPVPKIFDAFFIEDKQIVVLEKINYPLLDSVPKNKMHKYIPSMVHNLKKIHQVKSDKPGFLTGMNNGISWKEILLSKFNGEISDLNWDEITERDGLDKYLILGSVQNIKNRIEKTDFNNDFSLLHTDFNQRNLFIDPSSYDITAIIDWSEAMFGDPIYDFARVRMYIWHFNMDNNTLENYYKLISFSPEQKSLEELYWLSRIIEYLAYYSEELNGFNIERIKLHQDFLRTYAWK